MTAISIDIALQHLRYPDDPPEYIELLLGAAEEAAANYLGRNFYADEQLLADAVEAGTGGDRPMVINRAITAACLLMLGKLFSNREDVVLGVAVVDLPRGAEHLLQPYRIGMGI